ncbi:magnesium transporter [Nitratifractor sp.]
MGPEVEFQEEKHRLAQLLEDSKELEHYHASELARLFKELYHEEGQEAFIRYLRQVPEEQLGELLLELPDHLRDEALEALSARKLSEAVDELDSDDAVDLMQEIQDLDEEKEREVLSNLDDEDAREILALSHYDEDQAGSLMQTELFSAELDERVGNAIERLRRLKREEGLENIHQVFLVDKFGFLVGAMPLEDVITFDFDKTFRDYLDESHKLVPSVKAIDPVDEVVKLFEDYDLVVLPVTDERGKLIGRITYDDIVDVIEERATDQIYKMAGVHEETEEERHIGVITKKRAIWLGVNLVTAILASLVIGLFDETIKAYVALAVLMPIVASMGGNAGTQSLTVMVRQLALGEIDWHEAKSAVWREVAVSLLNGLIFAVVMGVIALLWFHDARLGLVIGLAMVINLIFAGLFGALIPLGLKRVGIDPAVASSVLLTTVTDVVGFFAFLGLAKVILLS